MRLGQDKGHGRGRIFRPQSWGELGRHLTYRLEIRVGNYSTVASTRGVVGLWGRERAANFSIDVDGQPDESDPTHGETGTLTQLPEIPGDPLLSYHRTTEPSNALWEDSLLWVPRFSGISSEPTR
jgi:hypothetical protein